MDEYYIQKDLITKSMKLYQILDEEGYDPIGQALTWAEMHEIVIANPGYTYKEANENFIISN